MFKKRKWSKYKHVMFVQDFRSGIKTYELLVRTDELTGETNYKKIYVKSCVHNLSSLLTDWFSKINQIKAD
jgi:hypothetical protein